MQCWRHQGNGLRNALPFVLRIQKQVVLFSLHPALTCKLKCGKQKASELDRVCWSQELGTLCERNAGVTAASANRTAMSPLCAKVLCLPRFIMCQGKVHKVFLRKGQWEVSPWSSSSGWCTAAYPQQSRGLCMEKGLFDLWFWRLDTDSLKETLCTLRRAAHASLILDELCTIVLQQ